MKPSHIILTLVAFAFLFAGCDSSGAGAGGGGGGETATYEIGDPGPSGVGIVFYISDGGVHGLEVAPDDQHELASWSSVTDKPIGTTGTEVGTGSANTGAIIGQEGHTASAAQICRDYRAAEEGDWFLPSKDELGLIYTNLYDQPTPVGGFASSSSYWSSSENDASTAWRQYFQNGSWDSLGKYAGKRVRAVRAF